MEKVPLPLARDTLVAERFEVEELLGQGGFGNVYLVRDNLRGDLGVMKELAPPGSHRNAQGLLELDSLGQANAQHLRQRFLDEARLLAKLHLRGIPQVRATFTDLGTSFFVSDYVAGAKTLQDLLDKEHWLSVTQTLDIVHQILDTLEGIHDKGYLHRDMKPSNILIAPNGDAYLLDFGSAREWHADAGRQHTILYTPGYAPMEQLSERARRGPATDFYALAATAYHMLTGSRPPAPPDRVNGVALKPIRSLRAEVPSEVAGAIELGLAMSYMERPQSAAAFRDLLEAAESSPEGLSVAEIDRKLVEIERLIYERRQCPSCGGVLDEPKPLKRGVCPVCHEGMIKHRHIDDRLCPNCRVSPLRARSNEGPLLVCPLCRVGVLHKHKKGLFGGGSEVVCEGCDAKFNLTGPGMILMDAGTSHSEVMIGAESPFEEWRRHSGRASEVWMCDGCGAQYDPMLDGRRRQVVPKPNSEFQAMYPDEWARVAAGLEPGSGNAECMACEADYFIDGESVTLLGAQADPNGFAKHNLGRLLTMEEIRWMGVGKDSPNPGYVCASCRSEFDREGEYLRLIQTRNRKLLRFIGSVHVLEDWHRIGKSLPVVAEEEEFRSGLDNALHEAYRHGDLSFDNDGALLWRGNAEREDDDLAGLLEVTDVELSFGGRIGRWKVPLDAATVLSCNGDELVLRVSGERQPVAFRLEPQPIEVELDSGRRRVFVTAEDLAARLSRGIAARR